MVSGDKRTVLQNHEHIVFGKSFQMSFTFTCLGCVLATFFGTCGFGSDVVIRTVSYP